MGGVLSNLVLVPLIWFLGQHFAPDTVIYSGRGPDRQDGRREIFRYYVRFIGVGAIATAGIFGIIKSPKIVVGSFSIAAKAIPARRACGHGAHRPRHGDHEDPHRRGRFRRRHRDLPGRPRRHAVIALVGLGLTLASFFFTSVAANAIATTACNPVSGMTMLTIIIRRWSSSSSESRGGPACFSSWRSPAWCAPPCRCRARRSPTRLTGYWLGSTPAVQEKVKFYGVICSAIVVGVTIVALAQNYQFGEAAQGDTRPILASPQASTRRRSSKVS